MAVFFMGGLQGLITVVNIRYIEHKFYIREFYSNTELPSYQTESPSARKQETP